MKKFNYTALTIGPIYKTLKNARKTRELWGGSYLFSYLMKQIIIEVKKHGAEIILPFSENIIIGGKKVDILTEKYEAGLFPDQLIVKEQQDCDFDKIIGIVEVVKESLIKEIVTHLIPRDFKGAESYFSNYFLIYVVQREFDSQTLKRDLAKQLFADLSVLELQEKYTESESENYMADLLTKASFKTKEHSFLIRDSREIESNERVRFESIIEISAKEVIDKLTTENKKGFLKILKSTDNEDEELLIQFLKESEETKNHFKTYHKYIAIVHIDGDNFGKINKNLDDDQFAEFSQCLAKYSFRTHQLIQDYGGLPVFVGGDDALFFAPVKNGKRNSVKPEEAIDNIFKLIDAIDKIFIEEFNSIILRELERGKEGIIPSLSGGISLTYYKFPLQEALEISRDQLFGKAKTFKGKNALSFNVLKHSGQDFYVDFLKFDFKYNDDKKAVEPNYSDSAYDIFKQLMNIHIEKDSFLSALPHMLLSNAAILKEIGKDEKRVAHFIDHNFDEAIHKKDDSKLLLELLKKLIPIVYANYNESKSMDMLYGALRMVKFINRKDNE